MIITSRHEIFYKLEITAAQAHHLQVLLDTGKDGHVNELNITSEQGQQLATDVHETIDTLRETLRNRKGE